MAKNKKNPDGNKRIENRPNHNLEILYEWTTKDEDKSK